MLDNDGDEEYEALWRLMKTMDSDEADDKDDCWIGMMILLKKMMMMENHDHHCKC